MRHFAIAGALMLALAYPAHAASAGASTSPGTPPAAAGRGIEVTSAGDLGNRFVYDKDGRNAGWAQYLMIDAHTGDIGYLVIGSDAGFDIGSKLIAVPWTVATKPSLWGPRAIVLDTTVDKLMKAPRLDRSELGTLTEPVAIRRVTNYYAPTSNTGSGSSSANPSPNGSSADAKSGSAMADPYFLVGQSIVEAIVPDRLTPATAIKDADVRSADGKPIGRIDRAIVDVERGRVAYLLMTRGDVLGLGGEWVPVPLEALAWSPKSHDFVLHTDAQKLREMQGFPRQELPARVNTAQLADLYRDFGLTPYWQNAAGSSGSSGASAGESASSGGTRL